MKQLKRGILLSVEGIDGAGKSTLVKYLVNHLQQREYPVIGTREPGATQLGRTIREIVQKKEIQRTPQAEYLLFAADRAQHFHEIVVPALQRKMIVISDRMSDSSLIYQGYARGLCHYTLAMINAWTMQNQELDLTFYIKIDAQTASERLTLRGQQLSVFEEKIAFTQKLIEGFEHLFAHNPRAVSLDGHLDSTTLGMSALTTIETWIHDNQLLQ